MYGLQVRANVIVARAPPTNYTLKLLWVQLVVLVLLHFFSALFSGLSLGMMSLTVSELEILQASGSV